MCLVLICESPCCALRPKDHQQSELQSFSQRDTLLSLASKTGYTSAKALNSYLSTGAEMRVMYNTSFLWPTLQDSHARKQMQRCIYAENTHNSNTPTLRPDRGVLPWILLSRTFRTKIYKRDNTVLHLARSDYIYNKQINKYNMYQDIWVC